MTAIGNRAVWPMRAVLGPVECPLPRQPRHLVGADRALKRLSLITCVSIASPGSVPGAPEVSAETSARDGLALMLGSGVRAINLAGGGGVVRLEDFFSRKS